MINNEEYEKILKATLELGRTHFVKIICENQKRIKELEEINEEHRKLNAELNQKIKEQTKINKQLQKENEDLIHLIEMIYSKCEINQIIKQYFKEKMEERNEKN